MKKIFIDVVFKSEAKHYFYCIKFVTPNYNGGDIHKCVDLWWWSSEDVYEQ